MTPDELRGFGTYIVNYSGGKDSTAVLLWALENLPLGQIRVVFADTTVEWPETYLYLDYIEEHMGIKIDRVQAGDRPIPPRLDGTPRRDVMAYETTFYGMVRKRGKWPSAKYRYCNTYLKRWPLQQYASEFEAPVQLEGTRAQESLRRSHLADFDPRGTHLKRIPVYRPILRWSERQVWDYLAHRILPNPVYNHATRCACWCCPMGRLSEVLNFCRLHPDIAQKAANLEHEIRHTWREQYSITNLLVQAQAQMSLFEVEPRFSN